MSFGSRKLEVRVVLIASPTASADNSVSAGARAVCLSDGPSCDGQAQAEAAQAAQLRELNKQTLLRALKVCRPGRCLTGCSPCSGTLVF